MAEQGSSPSGILQNEEQLVDVEELCQMEEHEDPARNSDSTHSDEGNKNVDSAAEGAKLNEDVNLFPKPAVDSICSVDDVEGDCKVMVDEGNAAEIQAEIVTGTSKAEELCQMEAHENPAGNSDSTYSDEVEKNVDSEAEGAKLNGDDNLSPKPTVNSSADDSEGDGKETVDEGNATEIQLEIVAGDREADFFCQTEEHENPAGNSDSTHSDEVEKNVGSAAEEAKLNGDDNLSPKPTVDGISNADDVEGDAKETVDEGNATEIQPEIVVGASKEKFFCPTEEHENLAGNSDSTHSDEVDKIFDSAAEEAKLNWDVNLSPKPTVDGVSSADIVEGDRKAMVDESNATEIQADIVAGTSEAEELHQMEEHENLAGNLNFTHSNEVEKNVDSAAEEAKLNGDANLSPKPTVDGISSADDVEGDAKATVNEDNGTEIQPEIVAGASKAEELSQTEELGNPAWNFDSAYPGEGDKNVDLEANEAKLNCNVKLSLKPTVDGISSVDDVEVDCEAVVDESNATEIQAEIVAGTSEAEELHQTEEHENPAGNSDSTHSDEGDKNVDSAAEEAKLNGDVNLSPKPTVDGTSSADNAEGDGKATVDEGNATKIQLEIVAEVSEGVPYAKQDVNVEKSKDKDESNVVEESKHVEESKDVEESKEVEEMKEVNESKKVEKELKETEDLKNIEQVKNVRKTEAEIYRPVVSYAEQVKEFDQESRLVKEAISDIDDLKPGIFCGRAYESSYTFTPEKEGVFSVSDLAWGKVKSHPWWPGQIFDSSDASEWALKYRKKDSFLVAYFGDQTFAWNEASSLNHFRTHFSQMEKQSNSDAFCIAVDYALAEFCRRVELSMVCSCTPKETRAKLKSQIMENAGIRQEARRRDGPNNSLCVTPFESGKLLQYIKVVALYPWNEVDRLELKIAQTQLLAFYRLKGYCRLPEFNVYRGLLENEVDSSGQESHSKEVIEHETPDSFNEEEELSDTDKLKSQDRFSHKHKHGSDEVLYSSRKKRSLSNLLSGKKDPTYLASNDKNGVDEMVASNSASSSGMKCNTVDPFSENPALRCTKRKINAESPTPQSFKVGECIRRIASQLAGSPPILKSSGKVDKGSVYDGFDSFSHISEHFLGRQVNIPEYSCPDEMLSQLCLAARDPMKGYSFLTTIVGFFSDFRNSISLESSSLGKQKMSEKKIGGGRSGIGSRRPLNIEISSNDTFDFEDLGDSYWTDRIIQSSPEKELSHRTKRKGTDLHSSSFEVEDALLLSLREKNLDEDYVPIKEKPSRKYQKKKRKTQVVLPVDETTALDSELFSLDDYEGTTEESVSRLNENNYVRASYPMALLMSFSELDSIPSEMNLNKIFRRFGPLKESETEVMRDTSSAKVVFKKQADAEVAFSSAAKFSIFGSAHVNYQLRNVWL